MGSFVFQWCVRRFWAMAINCGAATKLSKGKPRESFNLKTRPTSALTIGPSRLTSRQPRHHPAHEVYVTGTFDDWAKSIKLENKGAHFEKVVELPLSNEKIFYKVRYPTAPPFQYETVQLLRNARNELFQYNVSHIPTPPKTKGGGCANSFRCLTSSNRSAKGLARR